MRLGGETITKIFTGKITNWNDLDSGRQPGACHAE
jgi:ABC-type phosphate transport system substrate-binding protein